MKTAILFILMMLVLIAPHEFGHFIVAKLCGVKVNEFAIGMGPAIWKKQKGETLYSIRAIPIGGYNAMEGEDEDSEDPRAFNRQRPLKRFAILIAGVTMNVLIAIILCIIAVQISGVPVNKMAEVPTDKPAYEAGIRPGDSIVEVNGVATPKWTDVTGEIDKFDPKKDESIDVVYERDGKQISATIVPKYDEEAKSYMIGIVAGITRNPFSCAATGLRTTWNLNSVMLQGFKMIITGGVHRGDVSGPVGLVKIVDQTREYGAESYILLLALVSLNLALMNMLPIPALDGGKILFVFLKWISRGKITDDMEFKATMVGFIILMGLMVLLTVNDVMNLMG